MDGRGYPNHPNHRPFPVPSLLCTLGTLFLCRSALGYLLLHITIGKLVSLHSILSPPSTTVTKTAGVRWSASKSFFAGSKYTQVPAVVTDTSRPSTGSNRAAICAKRSATMATIKLIRKQ
uniref:Uncharacterized protein n=1 Tax=Anopheles atroparvus TaxID=41427 RepID=A0A182J087_ANOAO